MPPHTDTRSLEESLKGLNLTKEESDKFSKAFKDPKFIELFADYAKEVSDPKAKAETDQYLRQLESENRSEEVYGKDVVLIVPEAVFVVKTTEPSTGKKAYINMCTSSKVDPLRLTPITHADGRRGQQAEIPLSLGPRKEGQDKEGAPCLVFDFVVAPATLDAAHSHPGLMQSVVETAMENIERGYKVKLGPKFKQLNLKYKATPDVPKPHVLSVRNKGGAEPSSNSTSRNDPAAAEQPRTQQGGKARSSFSFNKKQPAVVQDPTKAGYKHEGGEVTPVWDLTHRGEVDLSQCWGDAYRNLAVAPASYPQALVLRLQLPGVTSAAGVELDVGRQSMCACVPGKFKLEVPLPHPVKDEEGKAKFDKAKSVLEVTLPTQPPPLPTLPPKPATGPVAEVQSEEGEVSDEVQGGSSKDVQGKEGEVSEVRGGVSKGQGKGDEHAPEQKDCEHAPEEGKTDHSGQQGSGSQCMEKEEEDEGYVVVHSPHKAGSRGREMGEGGEGCSGGAIGEGAGSSGSSGAEGSEGAGQTQGQGLSENQRKWLELHNSQQQQQQLQQQLQRQQELMRQQQEEGRAPSEQAGASPDGDAHKHAGVAAGTQEQQQAGAGPASGSAAAQKALSALAAAGVAGPGVPGKAPEPEEKTSMPGLKPRLMSNLAHDLD